MRMPSVSLYAADIGVTVLAMLSYHNEELTMGVCDVQDLEIIPFMSFSRS